MTKLALKSNIVRISRLRVAVRRLRVAYTQFFPSIRSLRIGFEAAYEEKQAAYGKKQTAYRNSKLRIAIRMLRIATRSLRIGKIAFKKLYAAKYYYVNQTPIRSLKTLHAAYFCKSVTYCHTTTGEICDSKSVGELRGYGYTVLCPILLLLTNFEIGINIKGNRCYTLCTHICPRGRDRVIRGTNWKMNKVWDTRLRIAVTPCNTYSLGVTLLQKRYVTLQ